MKKEILLLLIVLTTTLFGMVAQPVVGRSGDSIKSIERMVFRAVEENGEIKKGERVTSYQLRSYYKDKAKSWRLNLYNNKWVYNEKGLLVTCYREYNKDSSRYFIKENRYYNDKNKLVKLVENFSLPNGIDSLVWVWDYDDKGKPKSRTFVKEELVGVHQHLRNIFSYIIGHINSGNNPTYETNHWLFYPRTYIPTTRADKFPNGILTLPEGRKKITRKYNDQGDLISITTCRGKKNKKILDKSLSYTYNDRGDWIRILYVDNLKNEPLYIEERVIEYY